MIHAALRAISRWFHQHSVPVPGLLVQVCVVTVAVQVVGQGCNCRCDENVTVSQSPGWVDGECPAGVISHVVETPRL